MERWMDWMDECSLLLDHNGHIVDSFSKGPMSMLLRSVLEKIPVRVVVRGLSPGNPRTRQGIRGTCVGQLKAFDRHMNLVWSCDGCYCIDTVTDWLTDWLMDRCCKMCKRSLQCPRLNTARPSTWIHSSGDKVEGTGREQCMYKRLGHVTCRSCSSRVTLSSWFHCCQIYQVKQCAFVLDVLMIILIILWTHIHIWWTWNLDGSYGDSIGLDLTELCCSRYYCWCISMVAANHLSLEIQGVC